MTQQSKTPIEKYVHVFFNVHLHVKYMYVCIIMLRLNSQASLLGSYMYLGTLYMYVVPALKWGQKN